MPNSRLVHIDRNALRHNIKHIQSHVPGRHIMAMVKANGYGHGLLTVAQAIADVVPAFAVASFDAALTLRQSGLKNRIVLMGTQCTPDEVHALAAHHIEWVIFHASQWQQLAQMSLPSPVHVWLKIDTGMRRYGVKPDEVPQVLQQLRTLPSIGSICGAMTHFASADDLASDQTSQQIHRFWTAVKDLGLDTSLSNSAGILGWGEPAWGDWVRPGLIQYGVSPFQGKVGADHGLRPVMRLSSRLLAIYNCEPGEQVGYGGLWTATEPTRIGVVGLGYADGYPRHAPIGMPVMIRGQLLPMVGRVAMDSFMVDLKTLHQAQLGDDVLLWGPELPVEEVARQAGTYAYPLLCAVGPRVHRAEITEALSQPTQLEKIYG